MNSTILRALLLLAATQILSAHTLWALDPHAPLSAYVRNTWGTADGFSAFEVFSIAQTPEGYLWLGTDQGLYRFDGFRFTLFNAENTAAMKADVITSLAIDDNGTLWIASFGGLLRYDRGAFTSFSRMHGLPTDSLLALCVDHDNTLWIGTYGFGVCKLVHDSAIVLPSPLSPPVNIVRSIYEDEQKNLWLGIGKLAMVNPKKDSVRVVARAGQSLILSIIGDYSGTLWVGQSGGLFTSKGDTLLPFAMGGISLTGGIRTMLVDADSALWVGTEGGGVVRKFKEEISFLTTRDGLTSDRILSMFEDRDGSIWIGTRGGGLLRLSNRTISTIGLNDGLSGDFISAIGEDSRGNIWVGTRGNGLNMIRQGASPLKFTFGISNEENQIRALCEDDRKRMWVGTARGLRCLAQDRHGGDWMKVPVSHPIAEKLHTPVRSLFLDSRGNLWIGCYGGGLLHVRNDEQPVALSLLTEGSITNDFIRAITEDRSGTIWVGTQGGINRVISDTSFQHFSRAEGLSNPDVFTMLVDEENALWIGTYGGGLNRLKNGVFASITRKQGLYDDIILSLLDDHRGYYWMSCNRGVFKVEKKQLRDCLDGRIPSVTSISYGVDDGMASAECNGGSQPSAVRTREGILLFPTVKGVAVVDPQRLSARAEPSPPKIEILIAGGDSLNPLTDASLPVGAREFEIGYTAIAFHHPENVSFRYQLEGIDPSWVVVGTRRDAHYISVPPGTYTFRVMSGTDGRWGPAMASIQLTLPHFFWETWWFRLTCLALLLTGVFGITRSVSTNALKRRLRAVEAQQALERERSRISKDMHDEVGASLTQIAILSQLLERNLGDSKSAGSYVKKISSTAQAVAGSLDEIVWFINPGHDTLESLILYLREYLSGFFETTKIPCHFEVSEEIPRRTVSAETRRNTFLSVKEAANNIAKHAAATRVWIRITLSEESLEVSLRDDGVGIPSGNPPALSNGLKNMQKRMEDIGGMCEIRSTEGSGTTVEFRVTLKTREAAG